MLPINNSSDITQHARTPFIRRRRGYAGRFTAALFVIAIAVATGGKVAAAPDLGWAPVDDVAVTISNIHTHSFTRAAYGADGTAWVFYSEDEITGDFAKNEWLRFRYKRPGDLDWGTLTYSTIATRLVCDSPGGSPVFAALDDGRALLAYPVYGTAGGTGCTVSGIRVLLLDPVQPDPVESFFRGVNDCPSARNPILGVYEDRALVTWRCIPPGSTAERQHRVESAYFNGTGWSATMTVPEANNIFDIAGNSVAGTFHTIDGSPLIPRVVSHVFDTASGDWSVEELYRHPHSAFTLTNIVPLAIVAGDDGSVLAAFDAPLSPLPYNQVHHREPSGVWGEPHYLAYAGSNANSQLRLAAGTGGRFAAVWVFVTDFAGGVGANTNGVAGAVRAADGSWSQPADIMGFLLDDNRPGAGGVMGFPNGSFGAWWVKPEATGNFGDLYSATVPTDSTCWRAPVDMQQSLRRFINESQFTAGPNGDFLAAWMYYPPISFERYPRAVIAAGPDGTGGSDACLNPAPGEDTAPDPFIFNLLIDVPIDSQVVSNSITVSGVNGPTSISILGGGDPRYTYSVNCGSFTSEAGTVNNGDRVRKRIPTSANPATPSGVVLDIGGIRGVFRAVTVAEGEEPASPDNSDGCPPAEDDTTPPPGEDDDNNPPPGDNNSNGNGGGGGGGSLELFSLLLIALGAGLAGMRRRRVH